MSSHPEKDSAERSEQPALSGLATSTCSARFGIGAEVDLTRWNQTERPANRFAAPCVVIGVIRCQCESGYMVRFRDANDAIGELDQNWLKEIEGDLFTQNTKEK